VLKLVKGWRETQSAKAKDEAKHQATLKMKMKMKI
jgi:hypothetical protein